MSKATPEPNTGCWLWTAAVSSTGYGSVRIGRRVEQPHRALFLALHGAIPVGWVVRHKCDQPLCVAPAHLESGTQSDNSLDREARKRSMRFTQPHRQVATARHGMARLGTYDVFLVREMWLTGDFSQREIAKAVGISQGHVSDIVNNKTEWSQLWNGAKS